MGGGLFPKLAGPNLYTVYIVYVHCSVCTLSVLCRQSGEILLWSTMAIGMAKCWLGLVKLLRYPPPANGSDGPKSLNGTLITNTVPLHPISEDEYVRNIN